MDIDAFLSTANPLIMRSGMPSQHIHAVGRQCDHTQSKIQTVAELLLLSGEFRPIRTENTSSVEVSMVTAREQISSSLSIIMEIVHDITRSMPELKTRCKVVCDMLLRLSDAVTVLVELCYFVTYHNLAKNKPENNLHVLVDKYATSYAGLEVRLSCLHLKRARVDALTASFIMDMCSNISKYISVLTDNCRTVSQNGPDTATQDQFKLGVKTVTCAAGTLIACVKSYKADKSPRLHTRLVNFCEPVQTASQALVSLATEEEFVDPGRELTTQEKDIQKAVFGPCMSIVSGCVQICKSLRDFTYDTSNSHYIHKARSAHASVVKSNNKLKEELQRHFSFDFRVRGVSPLKGENSVKEADSSADSPDSHRELSPFGRCSPLPVAEHAGNGTENSGKNDLSPRSALESSDVSFASGLSR